MENKQTVLEKVINDLEQMKEDGIKFMTIDDFISELYQANEMFQKQIEEAYNTGCTDGAKRRDSKNGVFTQASDYFNKTYNK